MALATANIIEVRAAGSDNNAGAFNPANASFPTDGTVDTNTGNTTAPVFSSASYSFVAGDVGAWLFIKSGNNSIPGWYQIASVAGGKATLTASIGNAVLANSSGLPIGLSTAAGIATVGTPTSLTYGVDYSQQNSAQYSVTDLAIASTTTFTSASGAIGKNWVGNLINLTNANGSGASVKRYEVISTSGATATVDGTFGVGSGSGISASMGGALATWGQAETFKMIQNGVFIKSTSGYSISSGITTASTSNTLPNVRPDYVIGYTSIRLDGGKVTITASAAIVMVTLTVPNFRLENITLDGADTATTCWLYSGSNPERGLVLTDCGATRFATRGMNFGTTNGPTLVRPRVWAAKSGATSGILICGGCIIDCEVNTPQCDAITNEGNNSYMLVLIGGSVYLTNTGSVKKALNLTPLSTVVVCGVTLHTANGDLITLTGSYQSIVALNNIIYGAGASGTGYGINGSYARPALRSVDYNAFGNNATGNRNNFAPGPNDVTLTGDPCTNVAGGDVSLDNTSGEGAACRGTAVTSPSGNATSYRDKGGFQHQDAGGGSGGGPLIGTGRLVRN